MNLIDLNFQAPFGITELLVAFLVVCIILGIVTTIKNEWKIIGQLLIVALTIVGIGMGIEYLLINVF